MLRRTQKEESAWKSITIFVFGILKYKMCKNNLEQEQNNQLKNVRQSFHQNVI